MCFDRVWVSKGRCDNTPQRTRAYLPVTIVSQRGKHSCHRVPSGQLAGMMPAEDRLLSSRWPRNMGFPRAGAAGWRQEPPRKIVRADFHHASSLHARLAAGGEARPARDPYGSARRSVACRAPQPAAAASAGVFEKRICAGTATQFPFKPDLGISRQWRIGRGCGPLMIDSSRRVEIGTWGRPRHPPAA